MRLGVSFVVLVASFNAHAQTGAPCDASVPVKGCRAEIRLEGKFIVLKSDTPKCSVIEWTLDGSPRETTVLDGEERIELLTTRPKELTVDNCTQVKDLRAIRDSDDDAGASDLRVISRLMPPEYPPALRMAGIEGTVVVQVYVVENGSVGHAQLKSSPDSRLDDVALAAARGLRFAPIARARWTEIPLVFRLAD